MNVSQIISALSTNSLGQAIGYTFVQPLAGIVILLLMFGIGAIPRKRAMDGLIAAYVTGAILYTISPLLIDIGSIELLMVLTFIAIIAEIVFKLGKKSQKQG